MDVDFPTSATLLQLAEPGELSDAEEDPALFRLCTKPVRKLNPRELLALVQRGMALRFSAPLAIQRVEQDPLLQAAQYPGDLTVALLEADSRYWSEHYDHWAAMVSVALEAVEQIGARVQQEGLNDYLPFHLGDDFMGALMHFREIHRADDGADA